MKRNTENVTGNRPNMDRKRCSERSTDDGDLEKKDENTLQNVIFLQLAYHSLQWITGGSAAFSAFPFSFAFSCSTSADTLRPAASMAESRR